MPGGDTWCQVRFLIEPTFVALAGSVDDFFLVAMAQSQPWGEILLQSLGGRCYSARLAAPMTPEQQAVQRREGIRFEVLRAIFNACGGMENRPITLDETIASQYEPTFHERRDAATYLVREGLIQHHGTGHRYRLTHQGIVEMERAIKFPDHETEHFSQVVIQNVTNNNFGSNNVIGSVQTGGSGNTATVNQTVTNTITQRVVDELREKVETLPPEQHEEVHSVIDQIESAIKKGPKAFAAIRMLVTGLGTYFPHLIPWLSTQADLIVGSLSGMVGV